jgi:hypothetical protein
MTVLNRKKPDQGEMVGHPEARYPLATKETFFVLPEQLALSRRCTTCESF